MNMSKLLLAVLVASVGPILTTSGAFAYVSPVKTDASVANASAVNQNDATFTVATPTAGNSVRMCEMLRNHSMCERVNRIVLGGWCDCNA